MQPLLNGVCSYLESPSESQLVAHDTVQPVGSPQVELVPASPLVALAFKLLEGRFTQPTYMRAYRGSLKKSFHERSGKRIKVPTMVRMHSQDGGVSRGGRREPVLRARRDIRILVNLVPAIFAPSLVSTVRSKTRLQMAPPTIQWCVNFPISICNLEHEPSADLDVSPGPCHFASHQACWQ